jgi:hypothetical protein
VCLTLDGEGHFYAGFLDKVADAVRSSIQEIEEEPVSGKADLREARVSPSRQGRSVK